MPAPRDPVVVLMLIDMEDAAAVAPEDPVEEVEVLANSPANAKHASATVAPYMGRRFTVWYPAGGISP